MSQGSSSRLLTLDAMRGIAAILVMLYHLNAAGAHVFASGYLAVDFFFVLSGFVLARTYDARLAGGMPFLEYAALRLIRLYPLIFLGLLIGIVRAAGQIFIHHPDRMTGAELAVNIVFELLLLPSPVDSFIAPLNTPSWSLSFEVAASLVYAALLVKASRKGLVAVCAFCGAGVLWAAVAHGGTGFGFKWQELHWGVARVGFSFALGMLISRSHRRPAVHSAWAFAPMLVLAALLAVDVKGEARLVFDLGMVMLASPLLVWWGAGLNPPRAASGLAGWLGDVSYPLYAVHYPLMFMAGFAAKKVGLPPGAWMPVYATCVVALAWILDRLYDRPVRRLLTDSLHRARLPRPSLA